jgi:MFS family permease
MSDNIKGPLPISEGSPDRPNVQITGAVALSGAAGQVAGPGLNEMILFWASFFTLIAAGMGFSIRNDILVDWGRQFGFTQTELGEILGMGLFGFGLTIIFFSFFADLVGYGKLMIVAFLLHVAAAVTTLAAPYAYAQAGKPGAYWALYIGAFCFSLGNGTCEAVINPLTATLFPRNKTHWLNILHAGWPGGLVLGALCALALNQFGAGWQIKWAIVLAPMVLYGVMMLGRPFPTSEAKASGVSLNEMMRQAGVLGAAVVAGFLGLWLAKDLIPGVLSSIPALAGLPGWVAVVAGWGITVLLWVAYGRAVGFALGHWMLTFLFILHAMVGYVELGTDSWIIDITKTVLVSDNLALMAFIWTNVLMFTLRFFAGPIVHKISPLGLLFFSAVLGTTGLVLLGQPLTNVALLWMVAVTVYGIGKTFYWPTMLGVVSERFPRGGALALGLSGGIGMLSAGLLGGVGIGYKQDYASTRMLEKGSEQTYQRYRSDDAKAPLPGLPKVAGLDNGKVGVLANYMAIQEKINQGEELSADQKKLQVERDLDLLKEQGKEDDQVKELEKRLAWWHKEGLPNAETDFPRVNAARLEGGKTALTWTAAVPALMSLGYLFLILYFRTIGGYKAEVLVGHAAEDEKFTGGTEGPGEG